MTGLVKYEAACRAVADAASIDEAKDFRDQAEAMRAYARQAKNKQLEVQAAEIRIRAERRIGELMAAQKEAGHLRPGNPEGFAVANGLPSDPLAKPPTLAEVGIDKHLADRARKYAAIPEAEFNGIVTNWREKIEAENERVTVNLLAAGQKAENETAFKREPIETEREDPKSAKIRREFRALTPQAQEDDYVAIRLSDEEKSKQLSQQRDELAKANAIIATIEQAHDAAAGLANLRKQLGALKLSRDEALRAAKSMEFRLKKAEARVKELESEAVEI